MKKYKILTGLFFIFSAGLSAQHVATLTLETDNGLATRVLKKSGYKKNFSSVELVNDEINSVLFSFYEKGYLAAFPDSLSADSSDNFYCYINPGRQYKWLDLRTGNADPRILREVGFREEMLKGESFNYKELIKLAEKMLIIAENNGYPFASFKLDSVNIQADSISASICFEMNNRIILDSLLIRGTSKVKLAFLYRYFGLKRGRPYKESVVARIEDRLDGLPFLKESKHMEIAFSPDKAKIFLYLDKKKASQFNGILGVAPVSQATGKLMVTGEIKLGLLSAFGRGELIDLHWRKLEKSSQDLKFHLVYPYIFNSVFGLDYSFSLLKKDTVYMTLGNDIGIQYIFSANSYLKAFANIEKSSLLSTKGMENITVLPSFADISTVLYGLGINIERLDYRLNPRKGYVVEVSGAAGTKTIRENAKVNSIVYDSLDLKVPQYRFKARTLLFIPLTRKFTFLTSLSGAWVTGKNIFDNELFLFGGINTLRGFDEESFRASFYSTITTELRFLFERNSFLSVFWNGAYYERSATSGFIHDLPYGFGAGIAFDTKVGIFSLSYALGSQFSDPIQFRKSKIHFGMTSYF